MSTLEALQKEKAETEARKLEEERAVAEALEREQRLAEERLRVDSASAGESRSRSAVRKGDKKSESGTMRSRRRSTARSTASSDYRPVSRRSRSRKPYSDESGDDALSTTSGSHRRPKNLLTQTTAFAGHLMKYVNHSVGGQKMMQATVFMFALVWALAKKSTRSRLWRYIVFAWLKTMNTIGMGMKVTYV